MTHNFAQSNFTGTRWTGTGPKFFCPSATTLASRDSPSMCFRRKSCGDLNHFLSSITVCLYDYNMLHRSRTHKDDLAPDTFVKVSLSRATKVIKVESFHGTTLKSDRRWRRAALWGAAPARSTASRSTSSCRRSCWTPPPSTSPFLRWKLLPDPWFGVSNAVKASFQKHADILKFC